MEASSRYAVDGLSSIHSLSALKEGLRVQKSIPGLKKKVLRMLALNYAVFFAGIIDPQWFVLFLFFEPFD